MYVCTSIAYCKKKIRTIRLNDRHGASWRWIQTFKPTDVLAVWRPRYVLPRYILVIILDVFGGLGARMRSFFVFTPARCPLYVHVRDDATAAFEVRCPQTAFVCMHAGVGRWSLRVALKSQFGAFHSSKTQTFNRELDAILNMQKHRKLLAAPTLVPTAVHWLI